MRITKQKQIRLLHSALERIEICLIPDTGAHNMFRQGSLQLWHSSLFLSFVELIVNRGLNEIAMAGGTKRPYRHVVAAVHAGDRHDHIRGDLPVVKMVHARDNGIK